MRLWASSGMRRYCFYTAFFASACIMPYSSSFAGFEWIPAAETAKEAPQQKVPVIEMPDAPLDQPPAVPSPDVESSQQAASPALGGKTVYDSYEQPAPNDGAMLPLPGMDATPAPVVAPQTQPVIKQARPAQRPIMPQAVRKPEQVVQTKRLSPVERQAPESATEPAFQSAVPSQELRTPTAYIPPAPKEVFIPAEKRNVSASLSKYEGSVYPHEGFDVAPYEDMQVEDASAPVSVVEDVENISDERMPPAPVMDLPAPPATTKVHMPEDAPVSAMSQISKDGANVLSINPYPNVQGQSQEIELLPSTESAATIVDFAPIADSKETLDNQVVESADSDVVVGFGKDMPLALALRQIVPPQYSYSFASDVNPGVRVSWTGGKAWKTVLEEMLYAIGLDARYEGRMVRISTSASAALAPLPEAQIEETIEVAAEVKDGASEPVQMIAHSQEVDAEVEQLAEAADVTIDEYYHQEMIPLDETMFDTVEPAAGLEEFTGENVSIERRNVVDPGEVSQSQPDATFGKMALVDTEASELEVKSETTEVLKPVERLRMPEAQARMLVWKAEKGESLKHTLSAWSDISDFDIIWEADFDYQLNADVVAYGNVEQAVKLLFGTALESNNAPELLFVEPIDEQDRAKLVIREHDEDA